MVSPFCADLVGGRLQPYLLPFEAISSSCGAVTGMKVVIVESPAKAKTINKYLGKDFEVLASFGHVRDLPAKDGSVRPDEDFAMSWEVDTNSKKRLTDITRALKGADELILATDPDREGEAISWHLLDALKSRKAVKKDMPVKRVVFNAITKDAVTEAMKKPRDIDGPLVDAYLARRALDYLVGFTLSPILWRKLPGSRSAGRVQSVALRLVTEREEEIERFKPQEYWSVAPTLNQAGKSFVTRLYSVDGTRTDKLAIKTGDDAGALKAAIEKGRFSVSNVDKKPTKRNPYAPFTTSTLQQDASSRLSLSPSRTMQIAQRLYEDGLITYMRTDAVQMAPEAVEAARRVIGKEFGAEYVPEKPRFYSTKAKNAQEAHEAIRPTELGKHPDTQRNLDPDQHKIYQLIWRRALASQMRSAEIERTTADIDVTASERAITLRATGSVVTFPGFLGVYGVEKSDEDDEDSRELPALKVGDTPDLEKVDIEQHFTQPPARYTEASLIKKMEELGIGRPSTYASTKSRQAESITRKCCASSGKIFRTILMKSRICASPRCSMRSTNCLAITSFPPRPTGPTRGCVRLAVRVSSRSNWAATAPLSGAPTTPIADTPSNWPKAPRVRRQRRRQAMVYWVQIPKPGPRSISRPDALAHMSSWARTPRTPSAPASQRAGTLPRWIWKKR